MPIFILAGLAVLVNNVVFPWIFAGDTLTQFKVWGEAIINGVHQADVRRLGVGLEA